MMSKASPASDNHPAFISARVHAGYSVPPYLVMPYTSFRGEVTWSVVVHEAKRFRLNAMPASPRNTGEFMDIADTKRPC